ncbi:MAG: diphosphate--fructose-6-phosphate 1-phosphotransferase [Deltaproteobacteria bacterium HGW-Deltaproteobacteria-7]|jgi:6-phosphofructokinase 1|nr:MAG: diphosphate--fructose-6-phosphate 1-phosphotransferase [Deltaproteobacteria bacterium HGW-Deltaproteobacteria-7]PKN53406.1 MAG: diphosphate--fructose-6-phosphate 1-phosphotransferase [Deltaproteobacteria bacterium HGW-Deltaproteobacteria-13]
MKYDFSIANLGKRLFKSPLCISNFTPDKKRLLFNSYSDDYLSCADKKGEPLSVELAGPRDRIFFNPSRTKAAIVTCGGLCPGINDVIRSITTALFFNYNVRDIIGVKYGLRGLNPVYGHELVKLSPEAVKDITSIGGSILSTSRGPQDVNTVVDYLAQLNINILFCIGGDGTIRAAEKITAEIKKRKLKMAIVCIPKTIDNDLNLIQKSFGFDTAIEKAVEAIKSAHVEAKGSFNGIGLIKIMGRNSGHIAALAALAQNDTNFVLIPEVPFALTGPNGFLATLRKRMKSRGHAVILVAEGAGQYLLRENASPLQKDASGNIRLQDIGVFLKNAIGDYFNKLNMEINLKYIEPSYLIRSVPANASDGIYCNSLGQYAVHAGMAGKTGILVALMKDEYVHLPVGAVASNRKIDPADDIWLRVLEATGQPASMTN